MSEEVPGTTTTFTLFAFSKAGNTYCVYAFSMVPPFMPMYSVLVCAPAAPLAASAAAAATARSARRIDWGWRERDMVGSFESGVEETSMSRCGHGGFDGKKTFDGKGFDGRAAVP